MKRLLFFTLSFCLGFVVHAEYNVTSVIYDGNGQQCDWWANTGGAQDEPLVEKPMLPEKNEAPYTTNAKYLEMKRVQKSGREWHGIGFDLSGLNTTLSAGNQIAMWVKKDKAENVKLELQFTDGTSAELSDLQWVAPEDGWKYLVFDFSGQSGDIQGKQLGNMFVQVHTGGNDGQTATIQVTGIVKGFDLAQSNIPEHPYLLGSATENNRLKMTETQDGIYIWCGELSDGTLRFVQSAESEYPSFVATMSEVSCNPDAAAKKIPLNRITEGNGNNLNFAAGKYIIVLNTNENTDTSNPTMAATICPYDMDLYLIGNSTPAKWEFAKSVKMTETEDGLYTYTGVFYEGDLKILTTNTNYEPSFVSALSWSNVWLITGEANKIVYRRTWDDQDKSVPAEHSFWIPKYGAYKLSVDFRSSYPVLIMEDVPLIKVYTEGNLIYIENVEGEYTVTGSTGEYHAGQETAGGLVEISTQCNGVYEVEANGQTKRVLVY